MNLENNELHQNKIKDNGIPKSIDFNSKNHSTEIDSLRAIAILLVFFYHAASSMIIPNPELPRNEFRYILSFIFHGATGVTLFFVISSFLLTIPFYLNPDTSRIRFFKKRILRILPLYFIVVLSAGFITRAVSLHPKEVLRSFLFLFKTWDLFPFGVPWWSLRTEMEFYVFLGILMPLIHFRKGKIFLAAFLAVMFTGRYFIFINPQFLITHEYIFTIISQSVVSHAPTFLIGIITSVIYIRYGASLKNYFYKSRIFNSVLSDLIFILILAALSVVLENVSRMDLVATEYTWAQHYTYEALAWSLILLAVIVLPLKIKPLISNRILAYIGEISYSFYLIHLPIMFYINFLFLPIQKNFTALFFLKLLVILIVTLILSSLSYRYIEKPFLKIKDRI